ncbi:glycosyltransferase N-terminal domain-containing protein [Kiritimatiellota bacterium B12222]|nr:glycosyltransferase N-terminal domain-containing protein [Kiritimatiellota bacterium B12222]
MLPHFLMRMRKRGGYRKDFGQRLFRLSEEDRAQVSEGRKLWVHAVSVGELSVGLAFMKEWRAKHPETNFLLTVNTSTAHELAQEKLDTRDVLLYPPLDSPWVIRKVLNTVDVQGLVLVETEMWPNLLRQLHKKQVPVLLLNGRISDRSFQRLQKVPFYTQRLYKLVSLYAMQSDADAERAKGLGAPADRVQVMHSAKYDVASRNPVEELMRMQRLRESGFIDADATLLLGSSTWPGEEKVLMEFYLQQRQLFPRLRLILVPRHFERRGEVKAEADALGLHLAFWSSEDNEGLRSADVLMVDTTGELMHFTGLADLVFIGKSLLRSEGQNPLEAAHAGKFLVTGPGMDNFRQIMRDLREANAVVEAKDADDLVQILKTVLKNSDQGKAQGERAALLVESRKGSIARSVDAFSEILS